MDFFAVDVGSIDLPPHYLEQASIICSLERSPNQAPCYLYHHPKVCPSHSSLVSACHAPGQGQIVHCPS